MEESDSSTTTPPTEPGKLCDDGSNTWWKLSGSTDHHVDSRLQNKLQNNIVKRPLVLPGAFCIVIKKQLRYNIYVVEMIRKLDTKARY